MARYVVSPVAGEPNKARIFDQDKRRHLKSSSGGNTFLKAEAEAQAKRMNAQLIGKQQ